MVETIASPTCAVEARSYSSKRIFSLFYGGRWVESILLAAERSFGEVKSDKRRALGCCWLFVLVLVVS